MQSPPSAVELVFAMLRVNGDLSATIDLLVVDLGVTGTEWRVLRLVGASREGLTVPHVARKLGMTRQGVQRSANSLRLRGLITFEANEDHARSPRAMLTPKGREAYRQGRGREYEFGKRLLLDLTDEEICATASLLEKLRARYRIEHADISKFTDQDLGAVA